MLSLLLYTFLDTMTFRLAFPRGLKPIVSCAEDRRALRKENVELSEVLPPLGVGVHAAAICQLGLQVCIVHGALHLQCV